MWVFDSEEWTEDRPAREERAEDTLKPTWDASMPELLVIERVPTTRRPFEVPPLPLP